jgi:hypothetical protein
MWSLCATVRHELKYWNMTCLSSWQTPCTMEVYLGHIVIWPGYRWKGFHKSNESYWTLTHIEILFVKTLYLTAVERYGLHCSIIQWIGSIEIQKEIISFVLPFLQLFHHVSPPAFLTVIHVTLKTLKWVHLCPSDGTILNVDLSSEFSLHAQLTRMHQLMTFGELSNDVDITGTGLMRVVASRVAVSYGCPASF